MSPPCVYSHRPGIGEARSCSALAPGMWRAISSRGSELAAGAALGAPAGAAAGCAAGTGLQGASAASASNRNGFVEGMGIFTCWLLDCGDWPTAGTWTLADADRSASTEVYQSDGSDGAACAPAAISPAGGAAS